MTGVDLNQIVEIFLNRAKKDKVKPFFENNIQILKNTGDYWQCKEFQKSFNNSRIFYR